MPIIDWGGVTLHDLMSVSSFFHGAGDVAASRIAKEQLHRGIQPDEERFAFRSVWLAWKAARKLTGARREV